MVAWILGALAVAYLAYLAVISFGDSAEQAGYVIGFVGGAFLIALVIRWIYVRTRAADVRPAFWSPWIAVITAVIVLVIRVANLAG
jgi:hypothetical protein